MIPSLLSDDSMLLLRNEMLSGIAHGNRGKTVFVNNRDYYELIKSAVSTDLRCTYKSDGESETHLYGMRIVISDSIDQPYILDTSDIMRPNSLVREHYGYINNSNDYSDAALSIGPHEDMSDIPIYEDRGNPTVEEPMRYFDT